MGGTDKMLRRRGARARKAGDRRLRPDRTRNCGQQHFQLPMFTILASLRRKVFAPHSDGHQIDAVGGEADGQPSADAEGVGSRFRRKRLPCGSSLPENDSRPRCRCRCVPANQIRQLLFCRSLAVRRWTRPSALRLAAEKIGTRTFATTDFPRFSGFSLAVNTSCVPVSNPWSVVFCGDGPYDSRP